MRMLDHEVRVEDGLWRCIKCNKVWHTVLDITAKCKR